MTHSDESLQAAQLRDRTDPLRAARAQFSLPDDVTYLDGNSLGPPPRIALARLRQAGEEEWRTGLIRSWNAAGWIDLPARCGARIARLIGVAPQDVIVADSVSVNIFKIAAAYWRAHGGVLRICDGEFPTDGYILQGLSGLTGAPLTRVAPGDDPFTDGPGLLVKSAVDYKTASVADISAWENRAAATQSAILWDLSHAAGLVRLDLARAGARFAVGCGYKYLNGGPGAPAFAYVRADDADALSQPLCGWMGHAAPFAFAPDYRPAAGAARFASGTPGVLSMTALDAALEIFTNLDLDAVHAKARALGDLFLAATRSAGLEMASPPVGALRGGHVSLVFDHAYEVVQCLIARGVIGDFRAPNLMRFGFSPLFLSYEEVWRAGEALVDVLATQAWRDPAFAVRQAVT